MKNIDAIVVGAGPGGATAAYHLAKSGASVMLIEKEKVPRYKACGGGLTSKVRDILDFDFSPAVEQTINGLDVAYGPDRTKTDVGIAWAVMRDKFDALLTQRAVEAGAEFRDGEPVSKVEFDERAATVHTKTDQLQAPFVVGADGVNGIVRRSAGIPPHSRMAVALEAEMEVPSSVLEELKGSFHVDFGAIPWGYAWIFPKAEHLSVGIGCLIRKNHNYDLRSELARYVKSERSLDQAKEMFSRGHRIPLGGQYGQYHGKRAVLVGDAAGVVDPFTAEGIYYAIRSGQIAAEEITRALGRGDANFEEHTNRLNEEINSDFQVAWRLAQIFYRAPHLGFQVLAKSSRVQNAAASTAGGASSYKKLVSDGSRRLVKSLVGKK